MYVYCSADTVGRGESCKTGSRNILSRPDVRPLCWRSYSIWGGGGESQLLKGKFNENKVHLPHAANRAERSYIDWGIEL